jgi:serine/threonine-protein kinase HipA
MKIEIYLDGRWQHGADLTGDPGNRQRSVRLVYAADYAADHLFARDLHAVSVRLPVDFGERQYTNWPAFLIDLLPQGAARRRLERTAGVELTEWDLLQRGAVNPVGNLRVIPDVLPPALQHRPFTLEEMTRRADEFLDYAAGIGAAVTGATDTQGEAPKFWIVQDAEGRWYPDDGNCDGFAQAHALLKFPVPEAGINAQRILKNEAAFQCVAQRLGMRTTDEHPYYADGALVVPRFDRRVRDGRVERLGVESLYALCGVTDSTQPLRHDQVLFELSQILTDFDSELREYVWRDLFNLAVGNRDNHGRNTAVLKETDGAIRLAPMFDVGPTFLDARAITRVLRWDGEAPGVIDWPQVLDRLELRSSEAGIEIDTEQVARHMGDFGDRLQALPELMRECEVDELVIEQRQADIERLANGLSRCREWRTKNAPSPS